MDSYERDRDDRIDRDAALEKKADDLHARMPKDGPNDGKPLALFMAGALALTALVLMVMWVTNNHYDVPSGKPVAERTLRQ